MDTQQIESAVLQMVCHEFDAKPDQIGPSTSLTEDLRADSLALTNLALEIEDRFKIHLADEDLKNIRPIGDITGYIKHALAAMAEGSGREESVA